MANKSIQNSTKEFANMGNLFFKVPKAQEVHTDDRDKQGESETRLRATIVKLVVCK